MIEYAQLRPGPGFSPHRAALYYAQRLACPHWLRESIASVIAHGVAIRHPAAPRNEQQRNLRRRLSRTGLVTLPDLVSPDVVKEITTHLEGKAVVAGGRSLYLDQVTPDICKADYPLETVLSCAAVVALINAPEVLGIVSAYLGCSPTLSSVGLRWSFPSAASCDVQRFHRDPDDWKFVKLLIYLTDVDEGSGPHVYVEGSHRTSMRMRAQSYDLADIQARYGASSVVAVTGQRGTAFIADTRGIHMGAPARNRPRLMLTAQYSLLPVYAFRYRPIALQPRPDIDPYVNRLIIT